MKMSVKMWHLKKMLYMEMLIMIHFGKELKGPRTPHNELNVMG